MGGSRKAITNNREIKKLINTIGYHNLHVQPIYFYGCCQRSPLFQIFTFQIHVHIVKSSDELFWKCKAGLQTLALHEHSHASCRMITAALHSNTAIQLPALSYTKTAERIRIITTSRQLRLWAYDMLSLKQTRMSFRGNFLSDYDRAIEFFFHWTACVPYMKSGGVKYSPWSGDPNAQEQHLALAHTPLFVTALDSRLKIITMCCSRSPEHWAFVWVAECSINNL